MNCDCISRICTTMRTFPDNELGATAHPPVTKITKIPPHLGAILPASPRRSGDYNFHFIRPCLRVARSMEGVDAGVAPRNSHERWGHATRDRGSERPSAPACVLAFGDGSVRIRRTHFMYFG